MEYIRVLIGNSNVSTIIEKLGFSFKYSFSFDDYFYKEKNSLSSNFSLKMRVYTHNNWNCKNVIVIGKKTKTRNGNIKIESIVDKQEFDNILDAEKYLNTKYSNLTQLFKLSRTGKQYCKDRIIVWVETLEYLGNSVEIGFDIKDDIKYILDSLNVTHYIDKPISELAYNIIKHKINP